MGGGLELRRVLLRRHSRGEHHRLHREQRVLRSGRSVRRPARRADLEFHLLTPRTPDLVVPRAGRRPGRGRPDRGRPAGDQGRERGEDRPVHRCLPDRRAAPGRDRHARAPRRAAPGERRAHRTPGPPAAAGVLTRGVAGPRRQRRPEDHGGDRRPAGQLRAPGPAPGRQPADPGWLVIASYTAIAAGTLSGGWRIVRTMGQGIAHLRPVSGFAAETAAALAIFSSTSLGAPVSTTHTVAGAVTGAGATNAGASVNWKVFGRLVIAWVVTMPAAAVVAAITYVLSTRLPRPIAIPVMAALMLVLVTALILALRRAPKAADVEPARDEEVPAGLRPGAGSIIDARGVPASREVLGHGGTLDEAETAAQRGAAHRPW